MSTTTIRLDEQLKARVSTAAAQAGKTAHAFILDAIACSVEDMEADNAMHQEADARWTRMLASGKSVPWEQARTYLLQRAQGRPPPDRPAARKLRG